MNNLKFVKFIGYGLLAISVLITIAFLGSSNFTTKEFPMTDIILNWTYLMLVLASIVAVVMPLINIAKNPRAMVGSLVGFGIIAALLLVCYLMASDEVVVTPAMTYDNKTALLVTDAGLYATYITFVVAVIAIIGGELFKVFKR